MKVSDDLAPTRAVDLHRRGRSTREPPQAANVVIEGERVELTFVNSASEAMNVSMAHSVDFHAAEVAPSKC